MSTLEQVQTAISKQGLQWQAGVTPIGQNSTTSTNRVSFGLHISRNPKGSQHNNSLAGWTYNSAPLPPSCDWRSHEGCNWLTDVKDQGACGSCVAFATVAALETRMRIKAKNPAMEIDLSEAHLFFCGGPRHGCQDGWEPGLALNFCKKSGVGHEVDFPYLPKQTDCPQHHIDPAVRVKKWRKIGLASQNQAEMRKFAILRNGPVVGGIIVYDDFVWYKSGIYRPTTSQILGQHAVAIIGYDDDSGCWLVKNSWGTEWGDAGFCKIAYGTCGLDSHFDFFDMDLH